MKSITLTIALATALFSQITMAGDSHSCIPQYRAKIAQMGSPTIIPSVASKVDGDAVLVVAASSTLSNPIVGLAYFASEIAVDEANQSIKSKQEHLESLKQTNDIITESYIGIGQNIMNLYSALVQMTPKIDPSVTAARVQQRVREMDEKGLFCVNGNLNPYIVRTIHQSFLNSK